MMFMKSSNTQSVCKENVNWPLFYKEIWLLVIPMAIQNLITVGVTAADVFMLGKVGEKVLSGASLGGQVQYIMTLILFGITSGATVLTAQYWGKKDTRSIEKIMAIGLKIGIITSLLFVVMAEVFPEQLMRIFTNDPLVIEQGIIYIRIVALSYVIMSVTQIYLLIMRSIERVMIATVVFGISLISNILINAVLIFGLLGFPKMGIAGAATGTLISRIIEFIIVVWYAHFKNKDVKVYFNDLAHIDRTLFKDFLVYCMPVVLNELLWGLGTSANTAVIGHLGSAAVAANSVAQVSRQLATVVAFGVSNATAVYLGKTIGEGKTELAKLYGNKFIKLSLFTGAIGGMLILCSIPAVRSFMTLTPLAEKYVMYMFIVMSYFTVGQSLNTTLIVGVLRAGGDTKFGLALDMCTMWGCSILFGAIAAFVFHAPVMVVYVILMSDELVKIPFSLKRYFSYRWVKDVTRE